jgi:putative flavoprotein involved in K+ transport
MPFSDVLPVIVVGAGQAGVSLSYFLSLSSTKHLLLERDIPFSSWHSRWDGFRANTPNWMNTLPGCDPAIVPGGDPGGFATRVELLNYLDTVLQAVDPPIQRGEVHHIERTGDHWEAETSAGRYRARNVAVCTGAMNGPRIPALAARLPASLQQLHSSAYRRPSQLTASRVLLVGSGSSGTQICRELAESGRFEAIHLATSKVLLLPRHVLGIPVHRFLHRFGLFDVRARSAIGRLMYSGLENRGDPIMRPSPRDLSRRYGVRLHGKLREVEAGRLGFVGGNSLSLDDLAIIWCTGYQADYRWIRLERREAAFDSRGYPMHDRGCVAGAPGLFFVGLRYQHTVASHDFYGVGRDARYVASRIVERETRPGATRPAVAWSVSGAPH